MKIDKITPQIAGTLIGQKADLLWDGEFDREGVLVEVRRETPDSNGLGFDCDKIGLLFYPYSDVVFHLRRIESITIEEAKPLYKGCDEDQFQSFLEWCRKIKTGEALFTPTAWLYLLSRGFDLFGLIDAGLAKELNHQNEKAL